MTVRGRRALASIENGVAAFAAAAILGFVSAFMVGKTQQPQFGPPVKTVTVVAEAGEISVQAASARARKRTPAAVRYLVKPGDTLWEIAAANYEDAADGMRRIKQRNGLRREKVLAGEVLVLPTPRRR